MTKKVNFYFFSNINSTNISNYFINNFNDIGSFQSFNLSQLSQNLDLNNDFTNFCIIWPTLEEIIEEGNYNFDEQNKVIDEFKELISIKIDQFDALTLVSPLSIKYDLNDSIGGKLLIKKIRLSFCSELINRFYKKRFFNFIDLEDIQLTDLNLKFWFHGKIPYTLSNIELIYSKITNQINYLNNNSIKLIITDLDNTLWGGVIGDTEFSQISLGGHNAAGENYSLFQSKLKFLKEMGILLAASTKNEKSLVESFINDSDVMVLKTSDFVSIEANWQPKNKSVKKILDDLNLLEDSVLFIDDNPIERELIKQSFPKMNIFNFPDDIFLLSKQLDKYCFNLNRVRTDEDIERTEKIGENLKRSSSKIQENSFDKWLKNLKTIVTIDVLNEKNKERVEQLYFRTNQFNLSNRRLDSNKLLLEGSEGNFIHTFSVKDKFGDLGLTLVTNSSFNDETLIINDFIMSCRVNGRNLEYIVLNFLIDICHKKKLNKILFNYVETKKNKPIYNLLKEIGIPLVNDKFRLNLVNYKKIDIDYAEINVLK